ncbi:YqjF family protein [Sinosporangium siamense]|uniref:DUF2071 domain-containing protein n=1 Tax=Sinosporangium siamense TaxID=1367973 RepID=A0A919RPM4_9ACTN|nr:DUF2071 domain-containing protein [Sinosporangium siamense]GII96695.1 hypothetical protein Ssi02_69260 [Sinosporangium siamense]
MRTTQPPRIIWPVMYHQWSHMTFIHWRYPAALVQSLLPDGLTVEEFDGSAWVGLTPFLMENVRVPGTPALPWLSRFPETNVRTYVHDSQGRSGIWFLSLDAGRLPAVLGGRVGYRLPYHWSDMSLRVEEGRRSYRCRRRRPGPVGARCDADVELGAPLAEDELAHFLTARYLLFTVVASRLAHAKVGHRPWPLHHARLLQLDQGLVQAGGLTAPDHDPVLHASPGVRVGIGMWSWSRP